METCNGKINFQGRCDRCGQHAMNSSAYCLRTIEVIPPASSSHVPSEDDVNVTFRGTNVNGNAIVAEENIINFLLGSSAFKGTWYGSQLPMYWKPFWWRKHLREHLELKEKEAHNKAVQECIDVLLSKMSTYHVVGEVMIELEKLKQ